ncbi:hypothetical protein LEMLEM_LOCUS4064 [Lemmus lemmus]
MMLRLSHMSERYRGSCRPGIVSALDTQDCLSHFARKLFADF